MNIGFQRRQPRKSVLGTVHRRYSVQLEPDPTPKTNKSGICESTFTMNLTNLSQRPRKSMLGLRRRESTLISIGSPPKEQDEIAYSPEIKYTSPKALKIPSPFKPDISISEKRFNEMVSPTSLELNNSFERNETILQNEESILATTLVDNTVIENDGLETHCLENDCLELLNNIIKNNNNAVSHFQKQIDEIRKKIDETNRQTENIEKMKRRLMVKYDLKDTPSEPNTVRKVLDFQNDKPQNSKQNLKSPSVASPLIGEIRSTIKYLKTPRMSRNARPSVYLTPHSMSFSIKTQYEKLLE